MKKKRRPNILNFAILTLITVATWVLLDVYRAFTKPAPIGVPSEILAPLSPTIDQSIILQIQSRISVSEEEARSFVPIVPTPTPAPEEVTPATQEATPQGGT